MSDDSEYIEELDEDLMEQFSAKLEAAINKVIKDNPSKDSRIELLTTLVSFGAQVAQEMGVEKDGFEYLAASMFDEIEDGEDDESPAPPSKFELN